MIPADSAEALAWVHKGWDHLRLQRPIAAWASWNRALRIDPDQKAAQEALEILANADDLPAAARAVYRFRPPVGDERRARWDAHFRGRDLAELDAAALAFAELAEIDPADSSARYNQALALAWLGRNVEAIHALEDVVELDAPREFEAAVGAWMLAEVLRPGGGAEALADDLDYALVLDLEDGMPDPDLIAVDYFGECLHPIAAPFETDAQVYEHRWQLCHAPKTSVIFVGGSYIVAGRSIRFSSPLRENLSNFWLELAEWAPYREPPLPLYFHGGDKFPGTNWVRNSGDKYMDGCLAKYSREEVKPLPFPLLDAAVWTFRLPEGLDDAAGRDMAREQIEKYFECVWINLPRQSLSRDPEGLSPIKAAQLAAAGDLATRAKLTALVRSREQLAMRPRVVGLYEGYPFDRLRRRLGLDLIDPGSVDTRDLGCIGWEEASRLDPETLNDEDLEELLIIASLAKGDSEPVDRINKLLDARPCRDLSYLKVNAGAESDPSLAPIDPDDPEGGEFP